MFIFRKILQWKLKILAVLVLKKYKPFIVAVTGTVGKTSTKEAIYAAVSSQFSSRRNSGNYNNEIGVPLTILGLESSGKNIFGWLAGFWRSVFMLILKQPYPEVLVLEMGADRPGDIEYLTSIARPNVGVVTSVGEIPVHVEFYAGPKEVAKEKEILVKALKPDGYAILNYDDDTVLDMKSATNAHVLTFGLGEGALIRAIGVKMSKLDWKNFQGESGLDFKLQAQGKSVSVKLPGIIGKPNVYAVLAATGVGLALKMPMPDIISALHGFKSQPGRLSLLRGIKDTWIIDDSYNAAPQSVHAAIDILASYKAKRKIAVLGDMREIGKYTFQAHQSIGDRVAEVADILFVIGDKAKVIGEEAKIKGLDEKSVFWFDISVIDIENAGKKLQEMLKPGDLILVKGSQAARLEKIVEEVMAEPEKAGKLLVRQNKRWKVKKF